MRLWLLAVALATSACGAGALEMTTGDAGGSIDQGMQDQTWPADQALTADAGTGDSATSDQSTQADAQIAPDVMSLDGSVGLTTTDTVTFNGYTITLSRPLLTGRYAVEPRMPFIVLPSGGPAVDVLTIEHAPVPSSLQPSASWTPETYTSNGQPYDSTAPDYNAAHRLQVPFSVQPSSTPRHLHLAHMDHDRRNQDIRPHLHPEMHALFVFVDHAPTADDLMPPPLGSAAFKSATFSAGEVLSQLAGFVPSHALPSNMPVLADQLADLCRYHTESGYSNLSGGQEVQMPFGSPDANGYYPTYGSARTREMSRNLLALWDPGASAADREKGLLCAIQNIALPYAAQLSSNYATTEGGGQGGGFSLAAFFARYFLPSNAAVADAMSRASNQQRAMEWISLYRSPVDNVIYWGSPAQQPDDFYSCVLSLGHWGAGNWTYCTQRPQNTALWAQDFGIGGAYQEIQMGEMLQTAFWLAQLPAMQSLGDAAPIVEYVARYLTDGVQCYNAGTAQALRGEMEQAITAHNAATGSSIPLSLAAQKITEMQDAVGYKGVLGSHTYAPMYQWLLAHHGATPP